MDSIDIIAYAKDNLPELLSPILSVAGAVIGTIFFRRKKRTEANEQEFAKLKAGAFGEVAELLLESGELSYTEFNKMNNFAKIAKRADKYRQKISEDIPHQSFDWHTRFFESCGNVSNEELQEIWAKILAGEIYQPGSYSLRTIDCLRNLSKNEAELFEKVCHYSVQLHNNVILPKFTSIIQKSNIGYEERLRLEECGLLKSDDTIRVHGMVHDKFQALTQDEKWMLLVKKADEKNKELNIPGYIFTACGKELFMALGYKMNIPDFYQIIEKEITGYQFALGSKYINNEGKIMYTLVTIEDEKHIDNE